MAVENKYVNSLVAQGKRSSSLTANGAETITLVATVPVAAADDDGSIYRLFTVPSNAIPIEIQYHNTAITSGTDFKLGFYKPNLGAVVNKSALTGAVTMGSARTIATSNNAGMTGLDIANGVQTLATLSGQSSPDASYDIALTADTVGSAAGTIRVTATFAFA